jgi:hypothetical protein
MRGRNTREQHNRQCHQQPFCDLLHFETLSHPSGNAWRPRKIHRFLHSDKSIVRSSDRSPVNQGELRAAVYLKHFFS